MNLDNFKIEDMQFILNENTTLGRFYSLIPAKETLIERLLQNGIVLKSQYDEIYSSEIENLKEITSQEQEMLGLFHSLLHLHDFKNRSIKELKSMDSNVIETVLLQGYKKSLDILLMASEKSEQEMSRILGIDVSEARRLVGLCQLMRLPGVKDTRASLYYDAGLECIRDFHENSYDEICEKLSTYLIKTGSDKSMPLKKELLTQIAVSKILPIPEN